MGGRGAAHYICCSRAGETEGTLRVGETGWTRLPGGMRPAGVLRHQEGGVGGVKRVAGASAGSTMRRCVWGSGCRGRAGRLGGGGGGAAPGTPTSIRERRREPEARPGPRRAGGPRKQRGGAGGGWARGVTSETGLKGVDRPGVAAPGFGIASGGTRGNGDRAGGGAEGGFARDTRQHRGTHAGCNSGRALCAPAGAGTGAETGTHLRRQTWRI